MGVLVEGFDKVVNQAHPLQIGHIGKGYDVIILRQVLHHMTYSNQLMVLQSLHQSLKVGGLIWIEDHDLKDDNNHVLIDLVHLIRSVTIDGAKHISELGSNLLNYYSSRTELVSMFKEYKLRKLTKPRYSTRVYTLVLQKQKSSFISDVPITSVGKLSNLEHRLKTLKTTKSRELKLFIHRTLKLDTVENLVLKSQH